MLSCMQRQRADRERLILGITGSFGSGKTTVAKIFRAGGAEVIAADRLAHRCLLPASPAYRRIVEVFGRGILGKGNAVNRAKLAGIVFNHSGLLKKLNRIIHPQVIRAIKKSIRDSRSKTIILDAPLLVESGLMNLVDKLIVVKIDRQQQLSRLKKKTSLSEADILKRINAQLPLASKVRMAHFVIDNSGTVKETRKQVENIWKSL
jgi:dephospho-CoA kinase